MTNRFFAGQTNFIEELNALDGESGDAQQAIDDHIADTTGAHAASAISNTPAGNIAATTVQAAINELDAAKANLAGAAFTGAVSATSFTGPLSGNASTATTLATARNINGVSFNGSADITVTAAAGTLTGATLAAGVTASSLTSVGTLTALTVSGQASFAAGTAAAPSVKVGNEQNGLYSSAANTLDVSLNGVRQFQFGYTASAVDYFTVTGSAAGFPVFAAAGASANVAAVYATKGTSAHLFTTNGTAVVQLSISHAANAVNYWNLSGEATGGAPSLTLQGSDANINGYFATKGTGLWRFATSGGDQLRITHTASANRYLTLTGSNGASPTIGTSAGDLLLSPGGGALVSFGTHSALAAETVTGYITIKDSAGNTRKLAVVS